VTTTIKYVYSTGVHASFTDQDQMHGMVDVMGMMLITMSHDQKPQTEYEASQPDVEASDD
jgi:hypothetical protein